MPVVTRRAGLSVTNVKAAETSRRDTMAWTTPEICEVCVGMEVTAYASAEI